MKKIISIMLLSLGSLTVITTQNASAKNNPAGKWKFNAPDAPYSYNAGTIDVTLDGNKYLVGILMEGSDYKINGDKVKFENNILSFTLYIEGEYVSLNLKMDSIEKMSGKATYSEGEIAVALVRQPGKN